MNEHLDESAELYALGALTPDENRAVEAHVRHCVACRALVDEAKAALLVLAQHDVQHEPPPGLGARLNASLGVRHRGQPPAWTRPLIAIAAVLAIVILPMFVLLGRDRGMRTELAADDAAFARMAAGSFVHASFKGSAAAKVLYSADGAWYYVIVMHPSRGMHVAYVHNGTMEDLGPVTMHGSTGTLYLPVNHKMDELALLQDGRVVADANLTY